MPDDIHPRALAHVGDAVYELWIREAAIEYTHQAKALHQYTIRRVCAETQGKILEALMGELSDEEQTLVRKAQNLPVTSSRRSDHTRHRKATAFEALLGYWHLQAPSKLQNIRQRIILLADKAVSPTPSP